MPHMLFIYDVKALTSADSILSWGTLASFTNCSVKGRCSSAEICKGARRGAMPKHLRVRRQGLDDTQYSRFRSKMWLTMH